MLSIDSKLKKEGAESVEGAAPLLRGSTNWRVSGPLGEENREGADGFTRLTTLSKTGGRRITRRAKGS